MTAPTRDSERDLPAELRQGARWSASLVGPAARSGGLPAAWLPSEQLRRAVRVALNFGGQTPDAHGDPELREAIGRWLAPLGIPAVRDQVLTTAGATHALDIACRALLAPGDRVMVEDPGWPLVAPILRARGVHVLRVPRDAEGPDVKMLAHYCETHRPKLLVCVSAHHNPTGRSVSPARAHRVLQLAEAWNVCVVEDDTYGWLAPHAYRICALDGLQNTIHLGSFSKSLGPGLRVGYLAAPVHLVPLLSHARALGVGATSPLMERALAWLMSGSHYEAHVRRARSRVDNVGRRVMSMARDSGCDLSAPPGALFAWADLGVDADAFLRKAGSAAHALAAGSLFSAREGSRTRVRVNLAIGDDHRLWDLVRSERRSMLKTG